MEYIGGIAIYGLGFWLLNGIQQEINPISQTGNVYDFAIFAWYGSLIAYLISGGIWVVRIYTEEQYTRINRR